ncbi:hypothetical protein DRE_01584 [Drechslerella stenobrocha 248]|uniref:F-box domain-containing protein n=1 Tax=Drechslerella stenobrocha 248 TaxID=1043628 RepID=W7HUF4_9PEZI|nr:hypothetical protein DRE_01584 [Drechslerella stenobrocha 248]
MARLDDLPVDLKILIINNVDNLDSLISLCIASRSFYGVYRRYRDTITASIWESEIGPYKLEAYFIAAFYDRLRDLVSSEDDIENLAARYLDSSCDRCSPPESFFGTQKLSAVSWGRVRENHRAIRGVCHFVLEKGLSSRSSEESRGGSTIEKERITKALYRFWFIMLISAIRIDEGGGPPFEISRRTAALIFAQWSFWDFMAVKRVKDFFWLRVMPVVWDQQQFILDSVNTNGKPWRELAPFLFAAIVIYLFPEDIVQWFRSGSAQYSFTTELRAVIQIAARKANVNPSPPTYGFPIDHLNGEMDTSDIWNETHPIRTHRPGYIPSPLSEPYGQECWIRAFQGDNMEQIDFTLCIWDDWRLKQWGYDMPTDEEGIGRNRSMGLRPVYRYWRSGLLHDVIKDRLEVARNSPLMTGAKDVFW